MSRIPENGLARRRASIAAVCFMVAAVLFGWHTVTEAAGYWATGSLTTVWTALAAVKPEAARPRYRLDLTLDFDHRSYTGRERVRWVNRSSQQTSTLYFHLYPNLRPHDEHEASAAPDTATPSVADEPHLEITEVRDASTGHLLAYSFEDQATTLRVDLPAPVGARAATEIEIRFRGRVPEIDADETSLSAHVVQQIGAALRQTSEKRRARDINFRSRGVMLMGAAYPLLVVRREDNWQRKIEPSVGDFIYAEVADYEVSIDAPPDVALFTSGEAHRRGSKRNSAAITTEQTRDNPQNSLHPGSVREFEGKNLRSFAIVAGRALHSAERQVSGITVRSIWTSDHEKMGRRVLGVAAEAVRVYTARFGPLPLKTVSIAEVPLVAGFGCAQFTGLGVIASAFYVDFDSPVIRALPEIVREQRASVEDSLEFTAAYVVAHNWWGEAIGNDPRSAPVISEGLAHWSALLYYRETQGPERAAQMQEDQLRGVYEIYRTFGGEDMAADRAAHEYRNSFQYAAIVYSKGALMFLALQSLMGNERFWTALRHYYEIKRFGMADLNDLREVFVAKSPAPTRREIRRAFERWLSEQHGDEDVAHPNPQIAAALGVSTEPAAAKDRNAFSRLGRFFWRQMTRIP